MTREKSPIAKSSSSGFTLIETAIVIVISSLLLVAGLDLIKTWMSQSILVANQQRLNTIQQALANFETQYNRLPYPASFTAASGPACYGRESNTPLCTTTTGAVTFIETTGRSAGGAGPPGTVPMPPVPSSDIVIGALPVRDLGLPDSYIADTYGYRYTYAVTKSETPANGLNIYAGVIEVNDNTTPIPKTVLPLASDGVTPGTALYVVVDHGSDGKGAYTTSGAGPAIACGAAANGLDFNNCNHYASGYFSAAPFSKQVGANWFDDMIVYGTSLSALSTSAPVCEIVSGYSTTGGSSGGRYLTGTNKGTAQGMANVVLFVPIPFTYTEKNMSFQFDDLFDTVPGFDSVPGSTYNSISPTVSAYCPGATYHVVAGGCTQTLGAPVVAADGQVTNVYGGDIVIGAAAPPLPTPPVLFYPVPSCGKTVNCNYLQGALPPASHPTLPNSTGLQGWECNGSSASGMYPQAYAVCCTGSGSK